MVSDNSKANDLSLWPTNGGGSLKEQNERVVNALKDVHSLLELYAPTWYTEEMHMKTVAALQTPQM